MLELLKAVGDKFHEQKRLASSEIEESFTQATRHTERTSMDELYTIARPNEEPIYTKYRESNKRYVTVSVIQKFTLMLTRVLMNSIKIGDHSKYFSEFKYFVYDELLPLSIKDVNTVVIEWPFNPDNPRVAPALPFEEGGLLATKPVDTESLIVRSMDVRYYNDQGIIFRRGVMAIQKGNKTENKEYFAAADKQNFYLITPYFEKDTLKYRISLWYRHGLDRLPVADLPGYVTEYRKDGVSDRYKESICWGAFEYLDEAVIALSTDQVTRIRHLSPKTIISGDVVCPTCNGAKVEEHRGTKIPCRKCNGKGVLTDISDFSTIRLRNKSDQDSNSVNSIGYLNPPSGMEFSFTVWQDLIKKAEAELYTDPIEGSGNESGLAKNLRLEPKQDLLRSYGEQFCRMIEEIINNRIGLRENKKEREVQIHAPLYYDTKDPNTLQFEVENSMAGQRAVKYMNYIRHIHRGDELEIKTHELAIIYCPLVVYKADEIMTAINSGAYDAKHLIRKDYALFIMRNLISTTPDVDVKNLAKVKELFQKADQELIKLGVMSEAPLILDTSDEI